MLFLFFSFSLAATLFVPVLFPGLHLFFFVPFLIMAYYRRSLTASLWLSLLCGLLLDLIAFDQRLGLHALNYCLTTYILYRQKQNFFEDSLTTIPILTVIFSAISTLLQVVLLFIFENGLPLSLGWAATDLVVMPLCDGLYGLLCFSFPLIGLRFHRIQA
jgi:rod shape-determining protein MreD